MRKVVSLLLGVAGPTARIKSSDWWAYFGSFGDDIFCDEGSDDVS